MTERLLTLAQAADRCECSPKTLRRAIDSGDLVAVRLGEGPKSDRIHPADLNAFWASRRTVEMPAAKSPRAEMLLQVSGADEHVVALLAAASRKR